MRRACRPLSRHSNPSPPCLLGPIVPSPMGSSMGSLMGSSLGPPSKGLSPSNTGKSESAAPRTGFWKNPILYKTTLCDHWVLGKPCKYGVRCWYAHGRSELRYVPRLDQLPYEVKQALFVEPSLAATFFGDGPPAAAWPRASGPAKAPSSATSTSSEYPSSPDSLATRSPSPSTRYAPGVPWTTGTAVGTPRPPQKKKNTWEITPEPTQNLTERTFNPFMDDYPLRFDL